MAYHIPAFRSTFERTQKTVRSFSTFCLALPVMNYKSNRPRSHRRTRLQTGGLSEALQAARLHVRRERPQGRGVTPDRIQLPALFRDRPSARNGANGRFTRTFVTHTGKGSQSASHLQHNQFPGTQPSWYTDPERLDVCRTVTCGPDWPAGPEWTMMESVGLLSHRAKAHLAGIQHIVRVKALLERFQNLKRRAVLGSHMSGQFQPNPMMFVDDSATLQ